MHDRLTDLNIGESARIQTVQLPDVMRRRLLDLGLVRGTQIKALYESPAGDPIAYEVRGSIIALRKNDAEAIEIIREQDSEIEKKSSEDVKVIALAGNPNVGKSTVFNALTGMNQHTGNWPGKTVSHATGAYEHKNQKYKMVDLPGMYSLMATSVDEEVARDFICFEKSDCTVVVADATCLERNLNLVLQVLEVTNNVVLCVNLLDEAKKKKITIDLKELSLQLGIPVVGASARDGIGLDDLKDKISEVASKQTGKIGSRITYPKAIQRAIEIVEDGLKCGLILEKNSTEDVSWLAVKLLDADKSFFESAKKYFGVDFANDEVFLSVLSEAKEVLVSNGIDDKLLRDEIVGATVKRAEVIYNLCVILENAEYFSRDRKIDKFLTSKLTGIPVMILLLGVVFWITIVGANYPSDLISTGLFAIEDALHYGFAWMHIPKWLEGLLVSGMYRTLAWVVSVMLPPMAIFFPLFTLLEDLGYLPRIAFNMDKYLKKAGAHGKQALTMCMGFGCNACGVTGCRIIDSQRERLIATITNNFVPCNGRFPALITIISIFFASAIASSFVSSLVSALCLTLVIVFGIIMTLLVSKILSTTFLKGINSSFVLELPPYRKPQVGKVIVRSIFDRTLFVLGRAVVVAAPAGLLIFAMSNIMIHDSSLLLCCANFLDPFAKIFGLDGVILMAFMLGFPANEIVIPIIIMSYMNAESILSLSNLSQLQELLRNHGWTSMTAICFMLFMLMHFPCGTTCWTIKKETGSWKWTAVSFMVPTVVGLIACFIVASVAKIFCWV